MGREVNDLQLARLNGRDARGLSDHLQNLRALIAQKEDIYPGIERWFDKKVLSGISDASRIAYLGYVNGVPAAAAIVKLGSDTKLCHINVRPDLQSTGLGEILLSLISLEARPFAQSMHVTFPESLWSVKGGFFQSFGFAHVERAQKQYRLFDEELSSRTLFSTIWSAVLSKIPKLAARFSLAGSRLGGGVLFSIRPEFGEMIMRGAKTVEIRRRFSTSWEGQRAVFYAGEPTGALLGQAEIAAVHKASPKRIWQKFAPQIGCSFEYFTEYVRGCDDIYAIELADVNPLLEPVCSSVLSRYTSHALSPPQSYVALTDQQGWSEAVSISVMLQCLYKRIRVFQRPNSAAASGVKLKARKSPHENTAEQSHVHLELF